MPITRSRSTSGLPPSLWINEGRPTVEQRWFSGVHSDIGGGRRQVDFSEISLRAMADAVVAAGLGLDETQLPQRGDLDWQGSLSRSPARFWRHADATDRAISSADSVDQTSKDRYC